MNTTEISSMIRDAQALKARLAELSIQLNKARRGPQAGMAMKALGGVAMAEDKLNKILLQLLA